MRDDRRAQNEKIFRAVNDQLDDVAEAFEGMTGAPSVYVCECSNPNCIEQIRLSHADYERVRANGRRFIVVPGHEASPDIERVIERADDYLVIEKVEPEAGRVAS